MLKIVVMTNKAGGSPDKKIFTANYLSRIFFPSCSLPSATCLKVRRDEILGQLYFPLHTSVFLRRSTLDYKYLTQAAVSI